MTKSDDVDASSRWRQRPLCCRYSVVAFRTAVPQGEVEGPPQAMLWALGYLADGESEILGIWTARGSTATLTCEVLADLHDRGVVSFGGLVGCDAALEASQLLRESPGSGNRGGQGIPFQGQALRASDAMQSLRPAARRAALAADELAAGIDRRLKSARARHGAFLGPDDAMGFIAEFLMRANRRLYEQAVRRRSVRAVRVGTAAAVHA